MVSAFPISDWFSLIGFAALIGAGGQGARVIVGLKKLNDAASAQASAGIQTGDLVVASKLLVSLAIGAIAGGIAAATTMDPRAGLTGDQIAGLAAAGYAGADFIEGFMSRAIPDASAPAGQQAVGTGAAASAAAPAGVTDDAVG
jgi:hypothetical protein